MYKNVYHVQSTNVSTTGEGMAIFQLYVAAFYRDTGCVGECKGGGGGMRCGAVYHVQSTGVNMTGESMDIFPLYMGACYRDIGCVAV